MQESTSFWTEIKDLEDQLSNTPDSFCFARLAEIYLKVGLIDDALHVSRQGVEKYPHFLAGQRAFAQACHAKGLNSEALAALQVIADVEPEDVSAQKLLGHLLFDAGDHTAARRAFEVALQFAPDDVECQIELESLERMRGIAESKVESGDWLDEDDEEIIEDLEMLEDDDIFEEDLPEKEYLLESDVLAGSHSDPLSTGTLAELYVSQGFVNKALEIYRAILFENPSDSQTAERVAELELTQAGAVETVSKAADSIGEECEDISEDFLGICIDDLPVQSGELSDSGMTEAFFPSSTNYTAEAPQQGGADNRLSTFDGWLENIKRIKSCR
ncbi:MAG: tetratricopeptide repeat protein [Desulfuromonadaceae bacterium]|nr:tetratricopeptide repeat protein [Desulfuromonadaceae bacterium]MDD5107093.1 tetratricopeptide repeat protein [Desulfuromonadaceae bacterium]